MNHTDLIDRYLRNELTENEKKQFEGLLSASDKSLEGKNLNDEMELQKEIIMAIQARGLKECLQKKETEIRAKRSQRQRIIKISSWSFASSLVAANIVNISCLYGSRPFYGFMSHNMTKYGLEAFTKSAAAELSAKKVRVNCVTSCAIDTNSLNYVKANQFEITHYIEQLKLNIPLGRIAYPHEIAKVVLFLCSERSNTITGQIIKVDGGRSLTSSGYVHYKGIRNMNSVYEPDDVKLGIKYDFFGWNKSKEYTQEEIASMGEKELEEFIQQKCKESNFSTNNILAHIRHEVNYNKVEDNTMMLLNKNKK